jgi:serine/threonine protein kinase
MICCTGSRCKTHLGWPQRREIIVGTAKGLLYLHQDSRVRIVHRDIKASNILLDINFVPKIADFGLSKLFNLEQTHASTKVAGTL